MQVRGEGTPQNERNLFEFFECVCTAAAATDGALVKCESRCEVTQHHRNLVKERGNGESTRGCGSESDRARKSTRVCACVRECALTCSRID